MASTQRKFILTEAELPEAWYNITPDMPVPPEPLLDPRSGHPLTPEELARLMPRRMLAEAASEKRWVEIPGPVRDAYRLWRPSPLIRARGLEAALDTPARIYYKLEATSPSGSHKLNTALAQAFGAAEQGLKGLVTETGAGQWGSAMALACRLFGLECRVFMVNVSYRQKPYRRILMQTYGAEVFASPSDQTEVGRKLLAEAPETPGSLGIAISEAAEMVMASGGEMLLAIGSALSPVLMHQTIIGLEVVRQLEMAGERPDILTACVGAGSNFGGFCFPLIRQARSEGRDLRVIAAEPETCPTLTRGVYTHDYADSAGLAPVVKMHTLGHGLIPPGIHAGGLRYHGMAPQVSQLYEEGWVEARAVSQSSTMNAAVTLARSEGFVVAPESAHAVRVAIDEAIRCREEGIARVIAFNISGHGHYDLAAYEAHLAGELRDQPFPEDAVESSLQALPRFEVGSGRS